MVKVNRRLLSKLRIEFTIDVSCTYMHKGQDKTAVKVKQNLSTSYPRAEQIA